MILTEEQRAAIKLAMKYIARWPFAYKELHARGVLQAMIDSSEHVTDHTKMIGFDLEKARAADEALPYPLDANEIWVSGKGQMHINPPNAPSIFFTLSDLCEFRNLFHGQAAEIERLRAALDESEQILAHKTKTATHWYEEGLKTRADLVQSKRVVEQQAARLKELESSLDEAEALTKKNADLMNAYLARIAELEDALVEGLTNFLHYRASCYDPARRCPYAKECDDCSTWDACGHVEMFRSEARRQLQAEGKIGPDAKPRVWQITEERKAALWHAIKVLKENDIMEEPEEHLWDEEVTVLQAMLTEAE